MATIIRYKIAENIYVQGNCDADGVEITAETVKQHIKSETDRIEREADHHSKVFTSHVFLLILCVIVVFLAFIAMFSYSNQYEPFFMLLVLFGIFGGFVGVSMAVSIEMTKIQDHKDYRVQVVGNNYIIIPKPRRIRVINSAPSNRFS
jgi:Fe2+ transport system protein B